MAVAYAEIARVLEGARRRQGWVVVGTALGYGLAAILCCVLLGVVLLGAEIGPVPGLRYVTIALAGIAALAALAWAAIALMRRASTPLAVARTVGSHAPALKSDLMSSVELEEDYDELQQSGAYSVALVDAHIARTAERARGLDIARVVPVQPVRYAAAALLATAMVCAGVVALAPRTAAVGWRRLSGTIAAGPLRQREPITGDIELTYVYPAYMRREPRTISGTGGEISAPRGTEVRLSTRADRNVTGAEIVIDGAAPGPQAPPPPAAAAPAKAPAPAPTQGAAASPAPAGPKAYELRVANRRDLSGSFVVDEGGFYRFRFTGGKKVLAEGPPIPVTVEPDAFPEVRITAPQAEVEVDARARVRVEWTASDDVGLGDLTLVTKPPEGEEQRAPLRQWKGDSRRESGSVELELARHRLAEGEKLLYWLEVTDGDTVSGPKRAASATQTVKIYSEAEHHQAALARAQRLWEEMVALLGDRLGFFDEAEAWSGQRVSQAAALDGRTKGLHEGLRATAQELRRDRAAPPQLAPALANIAASLRPIEQSLSAMRATLGRMVRFQQPTSVPLLGRMREVDAQLDRELEKDVLYLEELFDKQRADDLVNVAKDLAARRRDLASLLESYKKAPSQEKKKELLAEVNRLKARMQDMMRRMSELAKGINDEHMNMEALAEMAKSKDALGAMDKVEQLLAKGDVEGAMRALDQLGNDMQQMLSSLERTAGRPGEQNAQLMKDMLAFKKRLEEIESEQQKVAGDTEQVKSEYRKRVAERLKQLEGVAKRLEAMAAEARREVQQSEKGISFRSEDDFSAARDRLADLEKALHASDFDAALETARRVMMPLQRLAMGLEDDANVSERYRMLRTKDPAEVRDAQRHASAAIPPARKVKDELEKMFPDPRSVLGQNEQNRLGQLAQRQGQLEREAGELRKQLEQLAQRAPIFPPQAGDVLAGSQGHMQNAQGQLAQRNPQAGHGEQRQALDELQRFRKGLEEMAKNSQRGGGGGGGFPFPFGEQQQGGREGDGLDPAQDKVEIPGADAYRVPDEFRRDLLEAMKQGAPDAYKGDVQRYYEELVK